MERVTIVGNSGSGKSTLGRRLAARLGAPWLELDGVQHQPGWTPIPVDEMRRRVADFTAGERWVVDGNYSRVRDIVWARADTVVWLDLPRRLVMWRVTRRTVGRWVRRTELWNGNRERARDMLSWDPERSVIRWAWWKHHEYRRMYLQAREDATWQHLRFVHLRSPRDVSRWLATVTAPPEVAR